MIRGCLGAAGIGGSGPSRQPELKLAQQFVSSIEASFDPTLWKNEYRERLCKMIEAKAKGEKLAPVPKKKRAAPASLADALKASIAATKEKKAA